MSLELLSRRLVESIAIGERDPLVASFWKIVFRDPEWLIHQIETIRITLENWDYFRNCKFRTDRELRVGLSLLEPNEFFRDTSKTRRSPGWTTPGVSIHARMQIPGGHTLPPNPAGGRNEEPCRLR